MQKKIDINLNITLILIYFALIIYGLLTLYSANSAETFSSILESRFYKQFLWVILSIILGIFVIIFLKPVDLFNYIPLLYIFFLLLNLFVAFWGYSIHGTKSWIRIAGFSLQPSEFLKYSTALFFARLVALNKKSLNNLRSLLIIIIPIILALISVLLQGDMGTALIFISFIIPAYRFGLINSYIAFYIIIYGVFFFFALKFPESIILQIILSIIYIISIMTVEKRFNKKFFLIIIITIITLHFLNIVAGIIFSLYLTIPIGLFIGTLIFFASIFTKSFSLSTYILVFILGIFLFSIDIFAPKFYSKLKPHQKERIEYFINPQKLDNLSAAENGVGYNIIQAKLSISAGGFTGRGYLKGTHNKLKYVPAKDTDYIFCTVAEELGFIGNIILFSLFILLFLQIIRICEQQKSMFSKVYGYSILGILFFHFFINIGSTLSLLPVIGIPLPFFSYGGSATISFTLMLSTLLMLDTYRKTLIEEIF